MDCSKVTKKDPITIPFGLRGQYGFRERVVAFEERKKVL